MDGQGLKAFWVCK